jgi:hypothetical protein
MGLFKVVGDPPVTIEIVVGSLRETLKERWTPFGPYKSISKQGPQMFSLAYGR